MVSSRRVSRKQSSGDLPALQLGGDNNKKNRNNNDISFMADNTKLLLICYFCYRCFSYHCCFFLAYAQDISLDTFFYIRTQFLIFNFGNNDLTMNRFIFLSFFLLQDNDSDHNNIPNSKHNNNVESVSFFPHVFNIVRYFFSQLFPYFF